MESVTKEINTSSISKIDFKCVQHMQHIHIFIKQYAFNDDAYICLHSQQPQLNVTQI